MNQAYLQPGNAATCGSIESPEMKGDRRGYTLLEVMVVTSLAVILAGLLFPVLSKGKRNAYSVRCMSNLKELVSVRHMFIYENKGNEIDARRFTLPSSWPSFFADMVEPDLLVCPESSAGYGADELDQLMIGVHERGNNDQTASMKNAKYEKIKYFMQIDPYKPWVKKLGWEQFEELNQRVKDKAGSDITIANGPNGGTVNKVCIDYWKNDYQGFEPGADPQKYVLFMEDYRMLEDPIDKSQNYTDFILFVEQDPENPYNSIVNAQHGNRGSHDAGFLVWADSKEPVHTPVQAMLRNDTRTISVSRIEGDYGANGDLIFNENAFDDRILFLDYKNILATPDNWHEWDDEFGVPEFARHMGEKINVAQVDGSVWAATESEIRLSQFSRENLYW